MSDRVAEEDLQDAPCRGLKVVDLGQGLASPYCGYLLAAYGADVVKIEPPVGDWARRLGTTYGDHSAISSVFNRGKRSLCLDMKQETARALVRRLALEADVFIEGFRPGVAARLGLGYEALAAENPRLIYVSISGFGQSGPYTARPCSDSIAQAFSGLVSVNVGADGAPHRVGAIVSDVSTGLYAYQAVATTLYARERTGKGRWLDISLTQSTAALMGQKLAEYELEGGAPRPLNAPAGSYETKDGWMILTLVTEAQFGALCRAIERPDLAGDLRYASFASRADHAADLVATLRAIFASETTDVWLERLAACDVMADRINDPSSWMRDPHVVAQRGALGYETEGVGVVLAPRTPGAALALEAGLAGAPVTGRDSRAVLRDAGLADAEIDRLIEAGAVKETPG